MSIDRCSRACETTLETPIPPLYGVAVFEHARKALSGDVNARDKKGPSTSGFNCDSIVLVPSIFCDLYREPSAIDIFAPVAILFETLLCLGCVFDDFPLPGSLYFSGLVDFKHHGIFIDMEFGLARARREPAVFIHVEKCPDFRPDAPGSNLEALRNSNPIAPVS